jgi:hypothetical protein
MDAVEDYARRWIKREVDQDPELESLSGWVRTNGNRLIFEIWWNFFYDLFSIKNVADVNNIDSFVSKRNMEEFFVVITKRLLTCNT